MIRVDTSSSNCLEEFDGSNLKPAVALSATGVLFRRSFGMIASDFWSNPSIECDPWKRKRKYSKFCRPEMDDGLTSENIRLTVKGFSLNPFPHPPWRFLLSFILSCNNFGSWDPYHHPFRISNHLHGVGIDIILEPHNITVESKFFRPSIFQTF